MKKNRNPIWAVLIVLSVMAAGCKSEEGPTDLEMCMDRCIKMYDECGATYIEILEQLGQTVEESELNVMQTECEEQCQAEADITEAQEPGLDCILSELSSECESLYSQMESRERAFDRCWFDCNMALDCETYIQSTGEECSLECESEAHAQSEAIEEFYDTCDGELDAANAACGYGQD